MTRDEIFRDFLERDKAYQEHLKHWMAARERVKQLIPEGTECVLVHEGEYVIFKRHRGTGSLQVKKADKVSPQA